MKESNLKTSKGFNWTTISLWTWYDPELSKAVFTWKRGVEREGVEREGVNEFE